MPEPRPAPRAPRRTMPPHPFEPGTMTWAEAAAYAFRCSESWLRDHLGDYPDFPRPDPQLALFSTEAVKTWVRRRFGLVSPPDAPEDGPARLLERVRAKYPGPLSGR